MDNGSQHLYMSDKLKMQLKMKPVRKGCIILNTFRNSKVHKKECEQFQVRLQGRYGNDVRITVLSFSTICSPLRTLVVVEQYPHLH